MDENEFVITYDAYRIKYKHKNVTGSMVNKVIMESCGYNLFSLLRETKNISHVTLNIIHVANLN